jgi:hypothetical protein
LALLPHGHTFITLLGLCLISDKVARTESLVKGSRSSMVHS